jgi:hypothetical protein
MHLGGNLMANVKTKAAQLGMGTLVTGLKAVESGVSKRKFKKVLATAVAQLLTMHPDRGPGQARRRARKVVGVKPSKKLLVKPGKPGLKEGVETAAVAAAGGAALKAVGKLGRKVSERLKDAQEEKDSALSSQQA